MSRPLRIVQPSHYSGTERSGGGYKGGIGKRLRMAECGRRPMIIRIASTL